MNTQSWSYVDYFSELFLSARPEFQLPRSDSSSTVLVDFPSVVVVALAIAVVVDPLAEVVADFSSTFFADLLVGAVVALAVAVVVDPSTDVVAAAPTAVVVALPTAVVVESCPY